MKFKEYKDVDTFIPLPRGIARELSGTELRIYLMLLEYYNKDLGYASPSYNTIRDYFGVEWSNSRIKQCLDKLETRGYIKIFKTIESNCANTNNRYRIYFLVGGENDDK